MVNREELCKACDGVGMLADDEGWQYRCPVCSGVGIYSQFDADEYTRIMSMEDILD